MTKEMYEDLLGRNKLQILELNTLTEEQDRHIIELEKENAELKNKLEILIAVGNTCTKGLKKQLTKAKEIIKNLVDSLIAIDGEQIKELKTVKEAEQFLNSEVEE